jgi:hypothetical protein
MKSNSLQSKIQFADINAKNYIVTIAIGGKYEKLWKKRIYPSWKHYAKKYKLGIIVINKDLIETNDSNWKKANWQKFLISEHLQQNYPHIELACYLDTDVLISPISPNIFKEHKKGQVSLISVKNNLAYDLKDTLLRLSWLRHYYSKGHYPLDSSLFMPTQAIYEHHKMRPFNDYACSGVFLFEPNSTYKTMTSIFNKYTKDIYSITNNGEQTHLNFEFQTNFTINWLDYKYQAIWSYEAANYYPEAFKKISKKRSTCIIEDSMFRNYFIHFSGNWPESEIWKKSTINKIMNSKFYEGYLESINLERTGLPVGRILSKKK